MRIKNCQFHKFTNLVWDSTGHRVTYTPHSSSLVKQIDRFIVPTKFFSLPSTICQIVIQDLPFSKKSKIHQWRSKKNYSEPLQLRVNESAARTRYLRTGAGAAGREQSTGNQTRQPVARAVGGGFDLMPICRDITRNSRISNFHGEEEK